MALDHGAQNIAAQGVYGSPIGTKAAADPFLDQKQMISVQRSDKPFQEKKTERFGF
jgi:hypothetical protein